MKTNRIYIGVLILTIILGACRKEDELEPTNTYSPFAVAISGTDATAKLQQDFYEATGCYLLFNDTLRHEYAGLDVYGNPYYDTELVDLNWNLTSVGDAHFLFEYLETLEEQMECKDFLENYLLPYFQSALPYAFLVVKEIDQYSYSNGVPEFEYSPVSAGCINCVAVTLNGLWEEGVDKEAYAEEMLYEVMLGSWGGDPSDSYYGGRAYDFFEVNEYDYEEDKYWYDIPYGLGDEYMELFYDEGFLVNTAEETLPTASEDAFSYIKACLTMTDEEFREKFGDYDKVIKKYEIIKPLVDATGIKL